MKGWEGVWRKVPNKEDEMGGACGMNLDEEECITISGDKARMEEATMKAKTWVGE
jgi:hypothetical protein